MPDPYRLLSETVKLDRSAFDRLSIYHDLLIKWQSRINLVSDESIKDVWRRHFLDSAQLQKYLPVSDGPVIDLGSGAGFPGMVLAILGAANIHLVESDGKKASFLKEVARATKTQVNIVHKRIEELEQIKAGCVIARALIELGKLLAYTWPLVSHETICLFPKGKNYSKELEEAKKRWKYKCEIFPSVTDSEGKILRISELEKMG